MAAIANPKISQITKHSLSELESVLRCVMLKVGLRAANLPDKVETPVLIAHIIENYGQHTIEEIKLAFDMAITGKLNLPAKEVTCYENFSCLYVSNILNTYRQWAVNTHKELPTPKQKQLPSTELSQQEKEEWINEWRNKEIMQLNLVPVLFYDYLGLDNYESFLEAAMNYSKQLIQKENISEQSRINRLIEFTRQEKDGFIGEFKSIIINIAKKMAIYQNLKISS